jgi:hypothetical protein
LGQYVRSIRVEDASGAQFEVHEFLVRGFIRRSRYYELDTGEPARLLQDNTYALLTTGERLVPV